MSLRRQHAPESLRSRISVKMSPEESLPNLVLKNDNNGTNAFQQSPLRDLFSPHLENRHLNHFPENERSYDRTDIDDRDLGKNFSEMFGPPWEGKVTPEHRQADALVGTVVVEKASVHSKEPEQASEDRSVATRSYEIQADCREDFYRITGIPSTSVKDPFANGFLENPSRTIPVASLLPRGLPETIQVFEAKEIEPDPVSPWRNHVFYRIYVRTRPFSVLIPPANCPDPELENGRAVEQEQADVPVPDLEKSNQQIFRMQVGVASLGTFGAKSLRYRQVTSTWSMVEEVLKHQTKREVAPSPPSISKSGVVLVQCIANPLLILVMSVACLGLNWRKWVFDQMLGLSHGFGGRIDAEAIGFPLLLSPTGYLRLFTSLDRYVSNGKPSPFHSFMFFLLTPMPPLLMSYMQFRINRVIRKTLFRTVQKS